MSLGVRALARAASARARREAHKNEEAARDIEAVAKGGLSTFTRLAFQWVEPLDFVEGWHIDMISEHLEAVTRGTLRRVVFNIPPGCMKSLSVCVMWPAWTWIPAIDPRHKFIFTSFADTNARRDAVRARTLIESDWYRARWPGMRIAREVTRSAGFYTNSHGGFRFSTSIRGQLTGKHGDTQVADDPIDPKGTAHKKKLVEVLDFWNVTMPTRQANPKTGRRVIVMQRLHELDLAGAMAREGGYEFVTLPMEFDPKRRCFTFEQQLTEDGKIVRDIEHPIGNDPREAEGELLWPARFDAPTVKELRQSLGPTAAAAQLDQSPLPAGGSVFRMEFFLKRYAALPATADMWFLQSWDMRFKSENDSGDYVVGQVWAVLGALFYLVDQVRGRWSLSESIQAIRDLGAKWPRTYKVLIENKANGPAVENAVRREVAGIELVEPKGGKIARAHAVEPALAAGNVLFPDPSIAPWIGDYVSEHVGFPKAVHDDQVDCTTQALAYLVESSRARYGEAWRTALEDMRKGAAPLLPTVIAAPAPVAQLRDERDTLALALARKLGMP